MFGGGAGCGDLVVELFRAAFLIECEQRFVPRPRARHRSEAATTRAQPSQELFMNEELHAARVAP